MHIVMRSVVPPVDDDEYEIPGSVGPDPEDPETILITLNALLNVSTNQPLENLDESNFIVYEDGVPREIVDVQETESAGGQVDMCFCLDISGSMTDERDGVIDSIECFVQQLPANIDVKLAIVTFRYDSNQPEGYLDFVDGRSEVETFRHFLQGVDVWSIKGGQAKGENAPMAVIFGWQNLSWRSNSQKVFIVITDEPCQTEGGP